MNVSIDLITTNCFNDEKTFGDSGFPKCWSQVDFLERGCAAPEIANLIVLWFAEFVSDHILPLRYICSYFHHKIWVTPLLGLPIHISVVIHTYRNLQLSSAGLFKYAWPLLMGIRFVFCYVTNSAVSNLHLIILCSSTEKSFPTFYRLSTIPHSPNFRQEL